MFSSVRECLNAFLTHSFLVCEGAFCGEFLLSILAFTTIMRTFTGLSVIMHLRSIGGVL